MKSVVVAVLLTLALGGCSKVNKTNYDRLSLGMNYRETINHLGEPNSCSKTLGTKNCIWGDENKHIKVSYVADTAVVFSSAGIGVKE